MAHGRIEIRVKGEGYYIRPKDKELVAALRAKGVPEQEIMLIVTERQKIDGCMR